MLILPDAAHPSGLRGIVVEDDSAGFPWGSLRLINVTDIPLLLRCHKEEKPLPVTTTPVDLAPGGEARNLGVELFKEDDPKTVLRRTDEWVFAPIAPYEITGDVGRVVFPCGWVVDDATDRINVYYGAADSAIAMATARLSDVLARVKTSPPAGSRSLG